MLQRKSRNRGHQQQPEHSPLRQYKYTMHCNQTARYTFIEKLVYLFALLAMFSCTHFEKNSTHQKTPDANIAKGKKLAAQYCQSCHILPDPSLLDSKTWEAGVLPGMGPRLGIFNHGFTEYPSSRYDKELDSNYYPASPVLSFEDWQYIIDYYTAVSPDSLTAPERKFTVKKASDLFSIEKPARTAPPATCMVKIDTTVSPYQIVTADVLRKHIYHFNGSLVVTDSVQSASAVVDVLINRQTMTTCNIGIMSPNNGKHGSIGIVRVNENHLQANSNIVVDKLARPVQLNAADFNQDGKVDLLVCEFGNLTGALSWLENMGDGKFNRHVIRAMPGAMKTYIQDVNHDGLPDIWALFAQGEEGIFLFINKGNGAFSQEEVIRFPPIYGSSYFEFADFNKDGQPDILYTCGDNADYSPVLKPYHGLYVYLNNGTNHFKQAYFFPMHGCFKAMARDFNRDGNTDIAAISFFADNVHHPEESFIYLDNKGNMNFEPYTIPGTAAGRWLTMDAGDIDGDGKQDIILGNFAIAPATTPLAQTWKDGAPFIVLKNIMKKN